MDRAHPAQWYIEYCENPKIVYTNYNQVASFVNSLVLMLSTHLYNEEIL